jgi:hypothetical protein
MLHDPVVHCGVECAGAHLVPQPPQLFVSLPSVLISQPSDSVPLQSTHPDAQPVIVQAPLAHNVLVLATLHECVQIPQLLLST